MLARRLGFGSFALACALASPAAHAQQAAPATPAPAKEPAAIAPIAPVAPPPSPVAPIAPIAPAERQPNAKPAATPAPQPASAATPAPASPSTAPTAVPAGQPAPQDDEPKSESATPAQPAIPAPPPTASPSTATAATDADITLESTPSEPGAEEEETPLPWTASIEWGQSYNANGIARSSQQSFDPQYVWDFLLGLGYRFDELTKIALRQPLTVELTDSDSTATRQELWLLDTTLDLTRKLWKIEPRQQAWTVTGGVGLVFPISPASQAANVIIGTRAKVGLDYDSDLVMKGLSVGTGLAYLRRWASSNVPSTDEPFQCLVGSDDIAHSCSYLGGATSTRDVLRFDVHGALALIEKLEVSASFGIGWNLAHGLAEADIPISTGGSVRLDDQSTHWRNTREIQLGVAYEFTDWFSAEVTAVNGFSERGPDGELRGPFHAVDMALGLNLLLEIDRLYYAQRSSANRGGGALGSQ